MATGKRAGDDLREFRRKIRKREPLSVEEQARLNRLDPELARSAVRSAIRAFERDERRFRPLLRRAGANFRTADDAPLMERVDETDRQLDAFTPTAGIFSRGHPEGSRSLVFTLVSAEEEDSPIADRLT